MGWLDKLLGDTQLRILTLLRRSRQSITSLAGTLGLTDNAVRSHVAALSRDGLVQHAGTERETGGKPARLYDLTDAAEELFPKAYAAVLAGLIEETAARDGWDHALELLQAVGKAVGRGSSAGTGDLEQRVAAAAATLRSLGADIDVIRTPEGFRLQGYACPLSAVTSRHPQVCTLAQALVAEATGQPVVEQCGHTGRPRCAFEVSSAVPDTP